MDDHIARLGMARLVDLKKGDKFYGMDYGDENVYELLSLTRILGDEHGFKYEVRELGTNRIFKKNVAGLDVVNRILVCRYRGRDRGSFVAGFKAAMRIYHKHMQVFDRENAGLDTTINSWMTMNQEYRNWMKGFK